ncbi:MAG: PEP/pyruvate-binding domain-containing protein [Mucilaginibacter sp.]|uniref:PEP/pyruvate-binding domain-containing protein n=1 Tax=Mucilaginibacter sp. TaxID=1882438 RepID=UPI0031AB5309
MKTYIKKFCETSLVDIGQVGYKNAEIGKLITLLKSTEILIPNGFIITAEAYQYFVKVNFLATPLKQLIESIDKVTYDNLSEKARQARKLIVEGHMPNDLVMAIVDAYDYLFDFTAPKVAIRSSIVVPQVANAAVSGLNDSYFNRKGHSSLLYSVKECFASLFTERAIRYAFENGYQPDEAAMSVGIQEMVRADIGCSGVGFTHFPGHGNEDIIFLKAIWGLGDMINRYKIKPDEYLVFKPSLRMRQGILVERDLGSKCQTLIFADEDDEIHQTLVKDTPLELQETYVLGDIEIRHLSEWALTLEQLYQKPMCFEWAKDGKNHQFYLLQVSPYQVSAYNQQIAGALVHARQSFLPD